MSDDLKMMCEYLPKLMKFKTKSERLVCAVMMFYANKHKDNGFEFSIPMVEISKITCIGRTTVCNAVKKLVDDGVFDVVCKGNNVSKKSTLYRLNRTVHFVDSQGVTDKTEQFGNDDVDSDAKPNSNRTVHFVDSQGVTDKTEQFGKTDGVEQKVNTKYKYKFKYKKYDNKEYGLTTINDNKRNDRIGDVNNESFQRLLNVLEKLVISVDTMNRNIEELKTIVSQQRETVDAVETTTRNPFSSKLECSVQPVAVDNINNQDENEIEQPAKTTISTPEDVCIVNNARSLVSEIEDKNSSTYATTISTTEETDDTVTPRSYFDIISSSPVATGIDIQQQTTFTSSTWVDIDDINDAKASLHSSRGSSTQDRITSLWVEIERGSDFESAYSELQGMFNAKVVTQRQWELTQRKYEKRKSSTSLDQNQKKEKEKKLCDTTNKTLMYFPQEQMDKFNKEILSAYNSCKTALNQEKKDGKSFDEEKYLKAFEQYAFGLDKLSDDTDDDGNRFGDYQYIKSKEWMKPFGKKSDATTREICERYFNIQAKKQAVVNA